jgi:hypothetical protein
VDAEGPDTAVTRAVMKWVGRPPIVGAAWLVLQIEHQHKQAA